jgi:hypothetical protein
LFRHKPPQAHEPSAATTAPVILAGWFGSSTTSHVGFEPLADVELARVLFGALAVGLQNRVLALGPDLGLVRRRCWCGAARVACGACQQVMSVASACAPYPWPCPFHCPLPSIHLPSTP